VDIAIYLVELADFVSSLPDSEFYRCPDISFMLVLVTNEEMQRPAIVAGCI
jgi:hypothetical protein